MKYVKEIIILLIQLFMFYVFPLFMGPTDAIGMVLLILIATFIISIIIVNISKEKYKYFYPLMVATIFIPSVYIYYNESALVHSIWYLIVSSIGILLGSIINKLIK